MPTLRLALLLLLALAALPNRAQTPIYHCLGADGHPIFTDQPCASVDATPAPAASASGTPPSLRPPAVTCAADREQLRQAAIDAFANGDANRLAGLMLWAGFREHAAVADIRGLAELMQRPLVDIEVSGGEMPGDPPQADDAVPALIVHTVADDGGTDETRFSIERHAGCLWLRQP